MTSVASRIRAAERVTRPSQLSPPDDAEPCERHGDRFMTYDRRTRVVRCVGCAIEQQQRLTEARCAARGSL